MAPIRIGLIGLSQSAKTSWAADGHLPYLISDRGRERFKIVALLNSSEDAARSAIQTYNLSPDVKAYGSPQHLAADPDVDLVVCTTRVDVHYETIKASIEAGKNVFCEWPLVENAGRASELANLAKKSGSHTLVGLQSRVAPAVVKVKGLLQVGAIGRVVSSDVVASTPGRGVNALPEGLAYFLDKKIGGNPVTIAFGHMVDFVHFVLGEYASSDAHLQIRRPNQTIVNAQTGARRETISDVPDLVSLHGTLKPSAYVADGASLIVNFRSGQDFPGTTPFVWTITGEAGRIRLSSERGPFDVSEASGLPLPIELQDFASGEVKQVPWEWESWQEPLKARGKVMAKMYDLYYEGRDKELGVADFDGAVVRHQQLDKMLF